MDGLLAGDGNGIAAAVAARVPVHFPDNGWSLKGPGTRQPTVENTGTR